MPTLSSGRVYDEQHAALDENGEWPSPSTGCWLTPAHCDTIVDLLKQRGVSDAVSIGCGEGASECMLESRGLRVHAVDLDVLTATSQYAKTKRFCTEIIRVRPDALYEITEPDFTCICFLWGRTTPWRAYLEQYPQLPLVAIVGEPTDREGDDCATEPRANALDGVDGWTCILREAARCVHRGAVLTVYARSDPP